MHPGSEMTLYRREGISALWGFVLLVVAGCQSAPKPEDFFHPVSLEQRQFQSRIFETGDEVEVLAVCAAVLQDNGFQIDEAESRLGLLVSSKVKMINGTINGIGVSIVTHRVQRRSGAVGVRVTFHHLGVVNDPSIYQEFFSRLSKALFLEAQQI